jgi:fibronectin-binding autotransporter adhesin
MCPTASGFTICGCDMVCFGKAYGLRSVGIVRIRPHQCAFSKVAGRTGAHPFIVFLSLCLWLVGLANGFSATLTWTGQGALNTWSTPQNWNPQATPTSLDSLVFPFGGANANNNMTGLNLLSITFNGTGNPRIFGNAIGLATGITNNCQGEAWVDLPIQLTSGTAILAVSGTNAMKVTREISGAPNLRKLGTGTLTLSGNNTFTGVATVEVGTLAVGYDLALGATSAGTMVNDGATLKLLAGVTILEPLTVTGTGAGGVNGAIHAAGTVTVSGPVAINSATINVDLAGLVLIDGGISGTGPLTKSGAGRVVLAGATPNTYSGKTYVVDGTLDLTKNASVLAVPGDLEIGPAAVGNPVAVARFNQTGQFGGTSVTVNASALLDLNGFNQQLAELILNDGGDVMTGAGILSFNGVATIRVGSVSGLGSSAGSAISGIVRLPANGTLDFDVAAYGVGAPPGLPPELDVPAAISGAADNINLKRAGFQKLGIGGLRISGNSAFAGSAVVNDGMLIVAGTGALGSTNGSTIINTPGVLGLEGGLTIFNEALGLNTIGVSSLQNRSGNNGWTGPITLQVNSTVDVSSIGALHLVCEVNGAGSLTKTGPGTLTLSGALNNTHAGNTLVHQGTLVLGKSAFLQAVPHDLIVGSGLAGAPLAVARFSNHDQIFANITVNGTGLLDLNGWDEYAGNLTLNDGGDVQTAAGSLYVLGATGVTVNPGSDTTSIISGRLGFDAGSRTITVGSGATAPGVNELEVTAVIFQANPTVNLTKAGPGRARFSGTNTYTGTTLLSAGVLHVDGAQSQSPLSLNGRLQGGGSVGNISYSSSAAAVIAPGASSGILTCEGLTGNVNGRGFLDIELNGLVPGSQHDQLNVLGTVNLTGIALRANLGFASSPGDSFVIINNDKSDAVTGTFRGLAQNARLYIGGELFRINYAGGVGANDVVLTRQVTPPQPTLTIEVASPTSVRLTWPTNSQFYNLQSTTNLTTATWNTVFGAPGISGSNYVVTNSMTGTNRFYRLISP